MLTFDEHPPSARPSLEPTTLNLVLITRSIQRCPQSSEREGHLGQDLTACKLFKSKKHTRSTLLSSLGHVSPNIKVKRGCRGLVALLAQPHLSMVLESRVQPAIFLSLLQPQLAASEAESDGFEGPSFASDLGDGFMKTVHTTLVCSRAVVLTKGKP